MPRLLISASIIAVLWCLGTAASAQPPGQPETAAVPGGIAEASDPGTFADRLLGFAGIGVGLKYANEPGLDLFLRPRAGLDVLVGRSGVSKPALFLDIGVNDGLSAGGIEAGVTVVL
jgi:hypothetical protein